MKNIYTIIAITLVIMVAGTLTSFAAPNTNSHKEATGTFYYTVEPPLVITTNTASQDLGAVCPGCTVYFQGPKCVQWTITGGASCNVLVHITNTTPPEPNVTIATSTEYSDDTPVFWESDYGEHADGNGGIFHIGNNALTYRVCAWSLSANNNASAGVNLTDVYTIIADYSNDVAPHL